MRLPVHQVCKGQSRTAELLIEPDTEVVQGELGSQAGLKATQIMRPFAIEAKRVIEFVLDSFHHLAYPRHPAAEPLRPRLRAVAFGWADHPRAVLLVSGRMVGHPRKALVHHIGA